MACSPSSQIRSTKTYLWYLSDVLGTGATSTVYRGRHKKTGDLVAAKAFNSISFMRPQSVQQREMDVLLKLSHRNIVKLYDIEQDQISKNPVIIMELCAGGSLHNILEDPKNSFGLEEEDFKQALGDVCAGMKHLRDLDIVHRDIKPGNIMVVTADDGTSIYKLADFGAARELQDDENFMSLYGTEEYLHPDLYERAVLRQPTHKAFSARIDLWSIGVTFYHLATGYLPFRPYGGRKNRETMFQITTRKASGVISGVQRDSMNGPIEWSSELPDTCRLSSGLKHLFTKILRGLLECSPERMWTFNRFFDEVQHVLAMKVVDVFHVSMSECLKVYVEPKGTLAEFQESLAELTGVQSPTQMLIWERDCFFPDVSQRCESYPSTSPQNPILLLEKGREDFPQAPKPVQPKLPNVTSSYDLDKDAAISKLCVAVLYFTLAWLQRITCMQELMTSVSKAIVHVMKAELQQLDYHCIKLKSHSVEVGTRLQCIRQTLPSPLVSSTVFRRMPQSSMLCARLLGAQEQVDKTQQNATEMAESLSITERRLKHLSKLLVEDDLLTQQWTLTQEALKPCYKCTRRFEFLTEEARKIYAQFRKDKQKKQLSYNEEQIHKMDKEKLKMKSAQAMSLCQSHCEKRWKDIHFKLGEWYTIAHRYHDQISQIDKTLSRLVREYQTLLQEVHMLDLDMQLIVNEFEENLQDSLGLGPAPVPHLPERKVDVATNTDVDTPPVNSLRDETPFNMRDITPNDIASISEHLAHLPIDDNGCVLVPRAVKDVFEAWERDIDMVTRQMEEGKQQLAAMQQMSLSFPNEGSSPFSNFPPLANGHQHGPVSARSQEGAGRFAVKNPPATPSDSLLGTSHGLTSPDSLAQFIIRAPPVADDWSEYATYEGASLYRTQRPTVTGDTRTDNVECGDSDLSDITQYIVDTRTQRPTVNGDTRTDNLKFGDRDISEHVAWR